MKESTESSLRQILSRWELWLTGLAVVAFGSAIGWFSWRVSQLLGQGQLRPFEATSLILQAVLAPLIAAPALAAALIGVATLRAHHRVQREARRPILDLRLTSALTTGASQYERSGTISITNLGPGPAIDVYVQIGAIGSSPESIPVGVVGSETSGASSSVQTKIVVPIKVVGQPVQLTATYLDLFNNTWESVRIYTSFPTDEGPLEVHPNIH